MPSYCTLQGARRQLVVANQTIDQANHAAILYYAAVAAVSIDDWTGRWFDERVLTLGFNGNTGKYNPILGLRDYPLAAIDTLTNGNGDVIDAAHYTTLPTGQYPKQSVRLNQGYYWRSPNDPVGSTTGAYCYPVSPVLDRAYAVDAIQIAGRWVYHRNYARAWRRLALTLGTSVNDTADEITLSADIGTAFDVGDILRFEDEQMLVIGPIASSKPTGFVGVTAQVERGYNGTTAAAHTAGAAIDIWVPEPVIRQATEMAAVALYKGRDNATGDSQIVPGFTTMVIPVDLPAKIKGILVPYRSTYRGRP